MTDEYADYRETMYRTVEEFRLPDVPEEGTGDRDLILMRYDGESTVIAENVTLADAQAYCSRDDTHGEGWFVGYDLAANRQ